MKRQMFFATAFSAALAVGAAAQTGTTTPQQEKSQPSQAQQVTMTGCLERAASGTAGTTGTETSAAGGGEFILANASSGSASSGTAGTTGTEPAGKPGAAMGSKYKLQGGDREDLQKYLNSKVEIRGTLERSSMGTGTATPQAEPSRPGQASTANLQTLRVSSVRQIAKTCEGGN